jgi:hypothetical protein
MCVRMDGRQHCRIRTLSFYGRRTYLFMIHLFCQMPWMSAGLALCARDTLRPRRKYFHPGEGRVVIFEQHASSQGRISSRAAGRVVILEQHASSQGNDISSAAAPRQKIYLLSLGLVQLELFLRFRAGPPSPRRLPAHAEFRGFLVSKRPIR